MKNRLTKLEFNNAKIPEFTEVKTKNWVKNGKNNDYPKFLTDLYLRSPLHSDIIDHKIDFIAGRGLLVKDGYNNPLIKKANSLESLYDIVKKAISDIEVYNSFYLKMTLNTKNNLAEIQHLPYANVRVSKDEETFYYAEDWLTDYGTENTKVNPQVFSKYEKGTKQKETIFFFKGKKVGSELNTYAYPKYIDGISSILTEIQIINFHKNAIDKGFKAGTMVVFKNGMPSGDEAQDQLRELKKEFTSTDDANEVMLVFVDDKDKVPEVISLKPNDFDKQYDALSKFVNQKIAQTHRMPTLIIFAQQVEGTLGGRTEMIDAYDLINVNYINPAQLVVEEVFNFILDEEEAIKIEKSVFIEREFSEQLYSAVLTRDELRAKLGYEPLATVNTPQTQTQTQENMMIEPFSLSKDEETISNILTFNPKITLDELVTFTKLSKNYVGNILKKLGK